MFDHIETAQRIRAALANDLPDTLVKRLMETIERQGIRVELRSGGQLTLDGGDRDFTTSVDSMVAARLEARKRKDFKESDRIRDELAGMGVTLKDTKNKDTGEIETTWELQR